MKDTLYSRYIEYQAKRPYLVRMDQDSFDAFIQQGKVLMDDAYNALIYAVKDQKCYLTQIMSSNLSTIEELLKSLENKMRKQGINSVWIHFSNPMKIPWYPLLDKTHPNLPGILEHDPNLNILKTLGFTIHSTEDIYYLDLNEKIEDNKDLRIQKYEAKDVLALKEFNQKMNHQDWNQIIENVIQGDSRPLLVAWHQQKIVGFTGPLYVEPSKRGYFAGIHVLDQARGLGLGKSLFHQLCFELKRMQASYMTFFTGRTNPAQHIYKTLNSQVVCVSYTMVKHI